jgi:tRNA1(Val) A37 N6-methylase TrmN6
MADATQDYLLDRRIRYAQPADIYRTGIEPVMLAAAVPAKPGQRVLELGTGAGAGLLCLATRVPGVSGLGVEIQAELVGLAQRNIAANNLLDWLSVTQSDVDTFEALGPFDQGFANGPFDHGFANGPFDHGFANGPFDHAFANPPWHPETGTASPLAERDQARRTKAGLFSSWAKIMAKHLRHRGTMTLILPAAALASGIAALTGCGCGSIALLPLWPKMGREAKIILVQATRGGAGPCRMLPGLTLHQPDGRYTSEAEGILRRGEALRAGI